MLSVYSVVFTLVLFSELSGHSVAVPASKLEDGRTEQEGLGLFVADEAMTQPAAGPALYRRSLIVDNKVRDEDGNPKIIILSDMGLKGHSVRGLNPVFSRGLPLLTDRNSGHAPAEYSLKIERRDSDLDMLRCMIGRVYRPCWQS
ncbi:pro-MCH [Centroberyx affinis]|uniref:pro-MCH n=1 Tax=Centroberyx affinis TaxID=166261 RepID=UPI003A5BE188